MDKEIELLVIGPNGKTSMGRSTVRFFSKSERFVTGLKKAGACLVGALLFVFVPGLHLIAVPMMHVLAVVMFVFSVKRMGEIVSADAKCPMCDEGLKVGMVEPNWPVAVGCGKCGEQLYIQDGAVEPLISISTQSPS